MPGFLNRAARRESRFLCRVLLDRGTLSVVDGAALAAYCFASAMAEAVQHHIDKYGQFINVFVIDKKTGKRAVKRRQKNPSIAIYNQAARLIKSFGAEFGLTPASRRNLGVSQ